MADRIRIPRYRTLIPNSTYGRDAELFRHPITEEKLQATQILQLSRYAVPSEDEVISLIQSTAREFNPLSTAEENQSVREIPLNEFMKMFPSEEVKMIQDGAKDSLSHLRNHCHTGDHQTGRAYLQAANGIIPNELLNSAESAIREKGAMIYGGLIDKVGAEEWYLRIRLEDNDNFPNSLELEYLLDRGVRDSDVFKVSGDYSDYQTVATQLRLLYHILGKSGEIRKIADSSEPFLKSIAARTIKETAGCLSAKKTIGGLAEGLIERIREMIDESQESDDEKRRKNLFGKCGFSQN